MEWVIYPNTRDYLETKVRHSESGKTSSKAAAADKVMLFH